MDARDPDIHRGRGIVVIELNPVGTTGSALPEQPSLTAAHVSQRTELNRD